LEIIMPTVIGRDELRKLTGDEAQLVEVLPAGDYDWAHLPGAVNLPLKELDAPDRAAGPIPAGHRVLPRLVLRHEPAGRVAARSGRVRPGL
jgi:rhodanese-related sulfurtransferase